MCTEPFVNTSGTTNILSWMYPITPTSIGPGFVVGEGKIITKHGGSYCWSCDGEEELRVAVFDREGLMVRRFMGRGRVRVVLDEGDGEIAVVVRGNGSHYDE